MKLNLPLCTIISALISCSNHGQTIASFDYAGGAGGRTISDHGSIVFGFWPTNVVFKDWQFRPDDAGQTFSASLSLDSGFQNVATRLTNGIDEELWVWGDVIGPDGKGGGSGTGKLESRFFDIRPDTGPDLIGYAVDRIELRLDELQLHTDLSANMTDFHYRIKVSVIGHVIPETPVSTLWLTAGIGFFAIRRWRTISPGATLNVAPPVADI